MTIKLNEGDRVHVKEIYLALFGALADRPMKSLKSDRFGAWSVTAIANLLCFVIRVLGMDRQFAVDLINSTWECGASWMN